MMGDTPSFTTSESCSSVKIICNTEMQYEVSHTKDGTNQQTTFWLPFLVCAQVFEKMKLRAAHAGLVNIHQMQFCHSYNFHYTQTYKPQHLASCAVCHIYFLWLTGKFLALLSETSSHYHKHYTNQIFTAQFIFSKPK